MLACVESPYEESRANDPPESRTYYSWGCVFMRECVCALNWFHIQTHGPVCCSMYCWIIDTVHECDAILTQTEMRECNETQAALWGNWWSGCYRTVCHFICLVLEWNISDSWWSVCFEEGKAQSMLNWLLYYRNRLSKRIWILRLFFSCVWLIIAEV